MSVVAIQGVALNVRGSVNCNGKGYAEFIVLEVGMSLLQRWCCFLYASRISEAFSKFSIGSHEFLEDGYPFHLTRYWCPRPWGLCPTIASTLYSSSPSIKSSGGITKLGPCATHALIVLSLFVVPIHALQWLLFTPALSPQFFSPPMGCLFCL